MEYQNLQFKQEGLSGYLTISRPKALNALNSKLLDELEEILPSLANKKIRTLIVQGAGDRSFVAGADIKEMSKLSFQQAEEFSKKGQRVFSLLEALPFPVIALIQGFALGGGLELALACDLLLLEEKAKIGLPEVTLGLFPSFGGTHRLVRAVGFYKAKEMIFSGAFYSAQEAYDMGLAQAVLPIEKLKQKAQEYAKTFQKRGPLAIAKAKQLIQHSYPTVMPAKAGIHFIAKAKKLIQHTHNDPSFQLSAQEFAQLFKSKDAQEGMKAFIEKRKPNFKGE